MLNYSDSKCLCPRSVSESDHPERDGSLQLGRQLPAGQIHTHAGREGGLQRRWHGRADRVPPKQKLQGADWAEHHPRQIPHRLRTRDRRRRHSGRPTDPHGAGRVPQLWYNARSKPGRRLQVCRRDFRQWG